MTNTIPRDENGRPIITLTPLEKTVIHVPKQGEYRKLMNIYKACGIMFSPSDTVRESPLKYDLWSHLRERTGITADLPNDRTFWNEEKYQEFRRFGYGDINNLVGMGWRKIVLGEYFSEQGVTEEMSEEINQWVNVDRWRK